MYSHKKQNVEFKVMYERKIEEEKNTKAILWIRLNREEKKCTKRCIYIIRKRNELFGRILP